MDAGTFVTIRNGTVMTTPFEADMAVAA
jgi:hypothetical protein